MDNVIRKLMKILDEAVENAVPDHLIGEEREEMKQTAAVGILERLTEAAAGRYGLSDIVDGYDTLEAMLEGENSFSELIGLAHDYGIESAGRNQTELAEDLAGIMLKPAVMREAFSDLHDEEIALVTEMAEEGGIEMPDNVFDMIEFSPFPREYFHMSDFGILQMTRDAAEVYKEIDTWNFQEERKKRAWFRDCKTAFIYYYGMAPVFVFADLFNRSPSYHTDEAGVLKMLEQYDPEEDLVLDDGKLIHEELYRAKYYREYEKTLENEPYVIPSYDEIREIGMYRYPYSDEDWQEFREVVARSQGMMDTEVVHALFLRMIDDMPADKVEDYLAESFGCEIDPEELPEILYLYTRLSGNTRKIALRGRKPEGEEKPDLLDIPHFRS